MTPIKSIREKCLDCCCNQRNEVKECGSVECTCWPYRNGRRPTDDEAEKHLQAKADMDEWNRLMKQRNKLAI